MKKEHIITIAPSILHKLFNSSCLSIHIQTCHFRLRIEASIKTYFRYRFLERIRTADNISLIHQSLEINTGSIF